MRRPFWWKQRACWYVKSAGRNIRLDPDQDKAKKLFGEMVAAERPESPLAPFAAIADAFLAHAKANVALKTYLGYSKFIVSFCRLYKDTRARELKPFHVTRWLEKQVTWNSETKRGAIAAVKRVCNWAVAEGLLDRNPLAGVRKPAPSRRSTLIGSDHHRAMVLAEDGGRKPGKRAATLGIKPRRRDVAFRPVLIALKHSGARPGMVASVRVEDVAPDLSCWVMNEHKTRKKTGRALIIYLSPCLQTLTRLAIGNRTSGPLFVNSLGKAWTVNAIRCRLRELRRKLGLPEGMVPYSYRHTFITTALVNGVGMATVAELAGHSDLKMISQHYGHLDAKADHLKKAAALAVARP